MLEVSGIRIPLSALDGSDARELAACRRALARKLRVGEKDLAAVTRRRRSIDARRRGDVQLTFTLRAELTGGAAAERALLARLAKRRAEKNVRVVDERTYGFPARVARRDAARPVVVGAGCAGLFCALSLARAGLEPLLVERGDDAARRGEAVARHNETGELDPESNIQFGVGGAGTFSDGKLQTGTKSPAHRLILETFVAAGAQREILWDAKPHVGSDVLPRVVTDVVRQIEEAGGEVRCRCRMTDVDVTGGEVRGVTLSTTRDDGTVVEERVSADCLVLCCGHSARDVFELLRERGVPMERKTFAMGVRIEHLQASVDRALYGEAAGHPALGAAPYSLSCHLPSGRSAFSFCMCPGGYVVSAASEPGGVCTNGMSLSDRAGANANSGSLPTSFPRTCRATTCSPALSCSAPASARPLPRAGARTWRPPSSWATSWRACPRARAGTSCPLTHAALRGGTWGRACRTTSRRRCARPSPCSAASCAALTRQTPFSRAWRRARALPCA